MSLQEYDALVSRMQQALEYAMNLGQYVDAARILFQLNEQLPDEMQLILDDIESDQDAKSFVSKNILYLKDAISEYRLTLE